MSETKFKLEKALEELDEIVKKLEDKNVTLDESVKLFQKGVELSRKCSENLTQIKGSVIKLKDELDSLSGEKFDVDKDE